MRYEPPDLPPSRIVSALAAHWDTPGHEAVYAPLGFGSHHWTATRGDGSRLFVTADRVEPGEPRVLQRLEAAYETASALREGGLSFVVAPVPDREGRVLRYLEPGWAMAVFAYRDGAAAGEGDWPEAAAAARAARLVGRLHASAPPPSLRRFSFRIPHRVSLFDDLDRPWHAGPYGEQARGLVRAALPQVQALLARYDVLVRDALRDSGRWVVSHGEPHSGNFIRDADGELYLIDWDTVRLAPRERDLAALPIDRPEVLAAYQATAGDIEPRQALLELFRAWWDLSEICVYTHHYRNPHEDTEDDAIRWPAFRDYLDVPSRWPALQLGSVAP